MFVENLKTIAIQVLMLYIIAGIGFAADKFGVFTRDDAKRVINLLFNIILPIAVVHSFLSIEYSAQHVTGLFIAFACAAATHLFGMGVSAMNVIGDEGVFYCSVYIGVFNIFAFTYGIFVISGKKAKINAKKIILNPGTISVIIGIPLFLLRVKLPHIIDYPMELAGGINSPLAMIIFGTFLANANFKNVFIKKEIFFVSFLRLVFIPVVMTLLFKLCGVSGDLLTAMSISASAPTATNTAMYAAKYDNDAGLGSEIAAQTSILSVVTMPVVVALSSVL